MPAKVVELKETDVEKFWKKGTQVFAKTARLKGKATAPDGGEIPSVEVMLDTFSKLLAWALYEKTIPTEVYKTCLGLVMERHLKFHGASDWAECKNEKCVAVQRILLQSTLPRIVVTPIQQKVMDGGYHLSLQPRPDGTVICELIATPDANPLVEHIDPVLLDDLKTKSIEQVLAEHKNTTLIIPGQ